jgi:CRISPR/Cas system-associated exonuclease Cas4 (RecB family)
VTLRPDFVFSQGSLQDYADCPRRFQLRYLLRVAWPALEAEPAAELERELELGEAFHRLAHQAAVGIPAQVLLARLGDGDLAELWRAYLQSPLANLPARRYPEIALAAGLAGYRLIAQFDLVAVEPGQHAIVVDWKTGRACPQRRTLAQRMQTRVYPYILVRAGAELNDGRSLAPAQVEMIYWYARWPEQPELFVYSVQQFEADEAHLGALIARIAQAAADDDFPLTEHVERCQFCRYRSLCARGVGAGDLEALDEAPAGEEAAEAFDFDQIAEIAF